MAHYRFLGTLVLLFVLAVSPLTVFAQESPTFSDYAIPYATIWWIQNEGELPGATPSLPSSEQQIIRDWWDSASNQQRIAEIERLEQEAARIVNENIDPEDVSIQLTPPEQRAVNQGSSVNDVVENRANTPIENAQGDSSTCSLWNWSFEECLWYPAAGRIAEGFMWFGGIILSLAGGLFDGLITSTITDFSGTMDSLGLISSEGNTGSLEVAWEAFRDVANIVLIGSLIFIAFSTIFGVEAYGIRRFFARLLIIAILLNFSLFFAKTIIDISNFTALQIYNASTEIRTASASEPNNAGIALAFAKTMGVSSSWEYPDLGELANEGESGWKAIGYGFLAMTFMLALSIILLYGAFLLTARVIGLILVMLTSALAFASYLIPGLAGAKFGWGSWWNALLKYAFFAPLLILFVNTSLLILSGANIQGAGLNAYLANPTAGSTWQVMFLFLIAAGLLYASIKLAYSLSFVGTKEFQMWQRKWITGRRSATRRAVGWVGSQAAQNRERLWRKPQQDEKSSDEAEKNANRIATFSNRDIDVPGIASAYKENDQKGNAYETEVNNQSGKNQLNDLIAQRQGENAGATPINTEPIEQAQQEQYDETEERGDTNVQLERTNYEEVADDAVRTNRGEQLSADERENLAARRRGAERGEVGQRISHAQEDTIQRSRDRQQAERLKDSPGVENIPTEEKEAVESEQSAPTPQRQQQSGQPDEPSLRAPEGSVNEAPRQNMSFRDFREEQSTDSPDTETPESGDNDDSREAA